eukprot:7064022-Ditylum_brightwellii.AAC.1
MSGCTKLAGIKYTKRLNKVAQYVHWNLLQECRILVPPQWFKHSLMPSVMDGKTTITWDLKM